MFKNPDFKDLDPLIGLAMFFSYNAIFGFSRVLGIEWVNVTIPGRGIRKSPSASFGTYCTSIVLICFAVFLLIAILRTRKRIKTGETTVKKAIFEYIRFFIKFFLWLILLAIILPPILRFMYYIF